MSARRFNAIAIGSSPPAAVFRGSPRLTVGNAPAGDTSAMCDYLDPGDGSGVRGALNEINGLGGGMVYTRRGPYQITSDTVLKIRGGTWLVGEGAGATLIAPHDTTFGDIINVRGNDCGLMNMSVESLNATDGTATVLVDETSENVTISGVHFRGVVETWDSGQVKALLLVSGDSFHRNIRVNDCRFEVNAQANGYTVAGSAFQVRSINGRGDTVFVDRCYFSGVDVSAESHHCVIVTGGTVCVTNSLFVNVGQTPVIYINETSAIDGGSFAHNRMTIGDSKYAVIVAVVSTTGSGSRGVDVHDNHIERYPEQPPLNAGIRITALENEDLDYCSVTDNYIFDASVGIQIDQAGGGIVNRTFVDGNQLHTCGSPIVDGSPNTEYGNNVT